MSTDLKMGTIIIPKPVHEFFYHIKKLEIPTFSIIAAAVKTAVYSIFRWHLYDTDSVLVKAHMGFLTNVNGKIELLTVDDFNDHPREFLLVNSLAFVPQFEIKNLGKIDSLALEGIFKHYNETLKLEPFKGERTLNALWYNRDITRTYIS